MGLDELRLAQDARFDRVGEYGTRLGYKKLCEPIGKTAISTGTAAVNAAGLSTLAPYSFTATADATIYSVTLNLSHFGSNYVVPKVDLCVNGEYVTSSCIAPSNSYSIGTTLEAIFNDAPQIHNGDTVEISVSAQTGSLDGFSARATTSTPAQLCCTVYSATTGGVSNVFEANIDGTKTVLFTFNEKLYRMASGGTVTLVRNLPSGVKKVRFNQTANKIRYADGLEKPHILDPSNSWVDTVINTVDLETETDLNIKVSNILQGFNDNLLYFDADTTTQVVWTYPYTYQYAKSASFSTTATISGSVGDTLTINKNTITPSGIAVGDWITGQGTATAEVTSISGNNVSLVIVSTVPVVIGTYDDFDRRFRQNFPALNTGDPVTAMVNLGGITYVLTRRNKYQMYSQTADAWTISPSNAQNGTFSQESIVCDLNYAYFATDSGVYIFDGSSEASLTENTIQNVYDAIPNKENIVLDLYKNRLYVYYTSKAGGVNDHCLVYNINLKVWESFDSNTFVSATSARQNSSRRFICGHSKFGMLMLNEDATSNNYSDMGQAIAFNVETGYQHFGSTSQLKRITKWRPEFATTEKPYTCECGYALDYTDEVFYAFSIDLQRQVIVNTNYVWDNPSDYGAPAIPTIHTTLPMVNGEFYRCQIRYQHIAAFEPVIFRSHTLTVQVQRIR